MYRLAWVLSNVVYPPSSPAAFRQRMQETPRKNALTSRSGYVIVIAIGMTWIAVREIANEAKQ